MGILKQIYGVFVLQTNGKKLELLAEVQGTSVNDQGEFDSYVPLLIGDGRRIKQILINLVKNALKFTTTGHIAISAAYYNNRLVLSV